MSLKGRAYLFMGAARQMNEAKQKLFRPSLNRIERQDEWLLRLTFNYPVSDSFMDWNRLPDRGCLAPDNPEHPKVVESPERTSPLDPYSFYPRSP